jgi:putative sporulation protein YyaC
VLKGLIDINTIIIGIGSDAFIFDSLGPLTATLLKERNIQLKVFGTLNKTINYKNIRESMQDIRTNFPHDTLLVIDASLGEGDTIGDIVLKDSGGNPGAGVNKKCEAVGDVSIAGIVESIDDYEALIKGEKRVRLGFVMELAKVIADAICYVINNSALDSNEVVNSSLVKAI